ncbi:putative transcriptional regulator [Rhizomicrobium palustre]|uniref:Putative transcriptional regulator n=1 Tax=Rhizomicrobium palustre TaxID=189966 RepID=A0A846MW20_9PROT|nr:BlaI/MecI/CopY family transcriptional regulator [Rhizomicrobium palustre]NIK87704.1 putative transcriptional regulator [Rhizomicrobium palustre]
MAAKEAKDAGGEGLSRREREIMDVLYKLGQATAAQVEMALADPPTYTAIRTHLTILEKKGHVRHTQDGPRYVYQPKVAREKMAQKAVKSMLSTFFNDSVEGVVAALLNQEDTKLSRDQLDRLSAMIEKAKEEGR